MYETQQKKERFILIAVEKDGTDSETNLNELSLLVDTAGAEEVGRIIQKRDAMHPGHYLGKGKLDEVMALVDALDADAIVADDELTASQQRNLAQRLNVKVLDRTMVILDIFAQRAQTAEGKAQVELAQLKYSLSHLIGLGISLSRQAGVSAHGGVGNRGPGEKKLELDRRHIRNRIDQLNKELKELRENRAVLRKKREKQDIPVVALVGYTNAGKSTLLNALTGAGVLAEDKLFATLDTTTRKVEIPNGGAELLFTDTVGFINKLPHHLIQAFRATLEETRFADILVHVVDASSPQCAQQMDTVYATLKSLECLDKPIITALNKMDMIEGAAEPDPVAVYSLPISAREGTNIPKLLAAVEKVIDSMRSKITALIPYAHGSLVNQIYATCKVLDTQNREDGTYMEFYATSEIAARVAEFRVTE